MPLRFELRLLESKSRVLANTHHGTRTSTWKTSLGKSVFIVFTSCFISKSSSGKLRDKLWEQAIFQKRPVGRVTLRRDCTHLWVGSNHQSVSVNGQMRWPFATQRLLVVECAVSRFIPVSKGNFPFHYAGLLVHKKVMFAVPTDQEHSAWLISWRLRSVADESSLFCFWNKNLQPHDPVWSSLDMPALLQGRATQSSKSPNLSGFLCIRRFMNKF